MLTSKKKYESKHLPKSTHPWYKQSVIQHSMKKRVEIIVSQNLFIKLIISNDYDLSSGELHHSSGRHLRRANSTGVFCRYGWYTLYASSLVIDMPLSREMTLFIARHISILLELNSSFVPFEKQCSPSPINSFSRE